MALLDIKRFEKNDIKNYRIHSLTSGQYTIIHNGKEKLLQIDTFGSDSREFNGKISQSLQFDKATLLLLKQIIEKEFQ